MSDAEELQVGLPAPLPPRPRAEVLPPIEVAAVRSAPPNASTAPPSRDSQELPLKELFQRSRAIIKQLETVPATDPATQRLVARGAECLCAAAAAVDALALFSANEDRDDLATADIKYLLIPFYQAEVAGYTHAGGRRQWAQEGARRSWLPATSAAGAASDSHLLCNTPRILQPTRASGWQR